MQLLTYRRFVDREQAEALMVILTEHGIGAEMGEDPESLDSLYVGHRPFDAKFHVKIKSEDFERADAVVLRESDKELGQIGDDHYLFQFTDQELYEILSKPDEWSELDYRLAAKILKDRGKEAGQETLSELKKQRLQALAQPDDSHAIWIVIGYIAAMLGGLLGILIGWHLSTYKKTLPDGQRINGYSPAARQHGNVILLIGIVMLVITFCLWLMAEDRF
jgi:hypothetical protein